jgi:hypothetical protein
VQGGDPAGIASTEAPQEEPSRRTAFATEKRSVWEHGFSDEEIEVMPAERFRLERKSTILFFTAGVHPLTLFPTKNPQTKKHRREF